MLESEVFQVRVSALFREQRVCVTLPDVVASSSKRGCQGPIETAERGFTVVDAACRSGKVEIRIENHQKPAVLCEISSVHWTTLLEPHDCAEPGAIGFDWVTGGQGGVPRLISWPRKKLIKQ